MFGQNKDLFFLYKKHPWSTMLFLSNPLFSQRKQFHEYSYLEGGCVQKLHNRYFQNHQCKLHVNGNILTSGSSCFVCPAADSMSALLWCCSTPNCSQYASNEMWEDFPSEEPFNKPRWSDLSTGEPKWGRGVKCQDPHQRPPPCRLEGWHGQLFRHH